VLVDATFVNLKLRNVITKSMTQNTILAPDFLKEHLKAA